MGVGGGGEGRTLKSIEFISVAPMRIGWIGIQKKRRPTWHDKRQRSGGEGLRRVRVRTRSTKLPSPPSCSP